jgi:ribosome-binding protein aMBF1 (putative translation factor)
MTAISSTYCLEGDSDTRILISREQLQKLFSQIEAELHHSDIYQQGLVNLQDGSTNILANNQTLTMVGREAIRLALRQLVRQYRIKPTPSNPPESSDSKSTSTEVGASIAQATASQSSDRPEPPTTQKSTTLPLNPKTTGLGERSETVKSSKTSRAALSKQMQLEQRQTILSQIGQELQHARQEKALSLEHLHQKTWIPIHHLKALETGAVDRLPEDIYIQGFIRRAASALKLDSEQLVAPFSALNETATVVPSWRESLGHRNQLRPVHLYLGYATLMAGAVSGLAWVSQDPASNPALPEQLLNYNLPNLFKEPLSRSTQPNQPLSPTGSVANPELAPPEAMPF